MNTRFGRWSISQKIDGLSLIELVVAVAVFSIVLVVVAAVQNAGWYATSKQLAHESAFRGAMLASEHLKRELPGALVEPLGPNGRFLTYRVPQRDSQGRPVIGPTGEVAWSEPVVLALDQEGYLIRVEGDISRRLSFLGPRGEVQFTMTPGRIDELQVQLVSHRGRERESVYELGLRFRLANQR